MKADRHLGRRSSGKQAWQEKTKGPKRSSRCEVMTASKRKPKTGFRFKAIFFGKRAARLARKEKSSDNKAD
ncbi:MAG: hypothetical protein AABZ23_07125 [Deltaproteobacteria bacterium]